MLTDRDRDWLKRQTRGMLTLGWEVGAYIQDRCVIPDGDYAGEPFLLTRPQWWFVLKHYELRADIQPAWRRFRAGRARTFNAFAYRRSQLTRSQKWGKGPLASGVICAEADGPVVFDGFDANGQPVGRPWATPWIQVTALAGDQTDNIWTALMGMVSLGPLADYFDVQLSQLIVPGGRGNGGRVEPVTSAAGTRLGQRITFYVHDQTESWTERETHGVARTQRRNAAGMGGRGFETPNAWDPAQGSVAQLTYETRARDIYIDYPEPLPGSIDNKRERQRILKHAYDGAPWVDLERIDAECVELAQTDPGEAQRWYFNRLVAGSDKAFDPRFYKPLFNVTRAPLARTLITAGFDGSKRLDSTGVVCCDIRTGQLWVAGKWERPEGLARDDDSWSVDEREVSAVVDQTFDHYDVWRLYGDPPGWKEEMAHWAARHGADRVIPWETARLKQAAYATKEFRSDLLTAAGIYTDDKATIPGHGTMSFGCGVAELDDALFRHLGNAVKRITRMRDLEDDTWLWYPGKDAQHSPRKIDLLMCCILAWQARLDAIRDGVLETKRYRRAAW